MTAAIARRGIVRVNRILRDQPYNADALALWLTLNYWANHADEVQS